MFVTLLSQHLGNILLVAALLWVCTAVGDLVLKKFECARRTGLEEGLFAAALGIGLVSTTLLLLGMAGGFQTWPLVALFVGFAILARRELIDVYSLAIRAASEVRRQWTGGVLGTVAAVAVMAAALFLLILSLQPPAEWDSLMYHLEVPARFLERGAVFVPQDNLHVTRIGLVHMLYVPLLAFGGSAAPAVLNATLALLLGLAVFSFSARFLGNLTATASVAVLWGSTAILLVSITARVDVSLTLFLFLAHYVLFALVVDQGGETGEPPDRGPFVPPLVLAAILLGFGFGTKYHGAPWGVALVPLVILGAFRSGRGPSSAMALVLLFAGTSITAALPWLIKNWLLVRAPLYPFLAQPILPPWLAALYGSSGFPSGIDPEVLNWIWDLRRPLNLPDFFLHPERLTMEYEGRFYWGNPILLCLPLWAFSIRRTHRLAWLLIPAALYLLILLVPFPGASLRYFIPALVPLTVVAVHATMTLLDRFDWTTGKHLLMTAVVTLALLPSAKTMYVWIFQTEALPHLLGRVSKPEYLESHPDRGGSGYAHVVADLNAALDSESRILMLFEARSYYLEPDAIQDNKGMNWLLLSEGPARQGCLADTHITHVLLNTNVLNYFLSAGMSAEAHNLPTLQNFVTRCLIQEYRRGGVILYRIRRGGSHQTTQSSSG